MPAVKTQMGETLRTVAFVVSIVLFIHPAWAAEWPSFSGNYKSFFTIIDPPAQQNSAQSVIGSASNRVRFDLLYEPLDWLSLQMAYDAALRNQDPSLFGRSLGFTIETESYRAMDLDRFLYPTDGEPEGDFTIGQNLDRAVVTFRAPWMDILIGRQAIAWGSAHAINPTDVLAPFTFDALDTEVRPGVDAARIRIPIGFMGEMDLGATFADDLEWGRSAFHLRGKFYIAQTDITLLLLEFREHLLAGIDLTRAIGGASAWLESAYVFTHALDGESREPDNDYLRLSLGCDYSFSDGIYAFIEYHANQAGSNDPGDYLNNLETPAFTEGSVYLMGQHYLIPGLTYQVTPLISLGGQVLVNIPDPSLLVAPQLEYNIAQDIYLSAGGFIGLGQTPEGQAQGADPMPLESEFGSYPDVIFTSFRIYF